MRPNDAYRSVSLTKTLRGVLLTSFCFFKTDAITGLRMTRRQAAAIAFILIASLCMVGCTSQKPQQATPTAIPTDTALSGLVIKATPALVPQIISETAHAPDHEFFGFNVTIENIDASATQVGPKNFQIEDSKGIIDGVAIAPVQIVGVCMLSTNTMKPDDTVNGIVVLDVPQGHQWTKLVYYNGANVIKIPLRVY